MHKIEIYPAVGVQDFGKTVASQPTNPKSCNCTQLVAAAVYWRREMVREDGCGSSNLPYYVEIATLSLGNASEIAREIA